MASDLDDLADLERRLCEVLAAYFEAVKAGQAPDRDAWLARHPDLAGQLSAFLDEQDRLLRMTEPLRSIVKGRHGPAMRAPLGGARPTGTAGSAVPLRRLRAARRADPRWDEPRVPRAAAEPQSPRGVEDSPRRDTGGRRRRAPVPAGGRGGRQSRSPEHRADLRGRGARWIQLLCDEADRGGQPRAEIGRISE